MMRLFFLLIFTFPAWGLEPWQGQDYAVESWRCGAPLVIALRQYDPDGLLNDSAGKLKLKESLEKISDSNLNYLRKKVGQLSNEEKQLVHLMETKFQAPVIHRAPLDASKIILTQSHGLKSATKRNTSARVTPNIEQHLFSGFDCIFTSVGSPFGIQDYGTVLFRFVEEKSFAWGTVLTGFTWTKEVLQYDITRPATNSMKRKFARMVFTNNHWNEAMALQLIENVRKGISIRGKGAPYNQQTIISELLKINSRTNFWRKIVYHRLAFLEGHYTDDIPMKDFLFVQFRSADETSVRSWGLPRSMFTSPAPNGLIQFFKRDN